MKDQLFALKPANQYQTSYGTLSLPRQSVSVTEKQSKDWQKANMDFFDYASTSQMQDKVRYMKNIQYLQGHIDPKDYEDVLDPMYLGVDRETKYGKTAAIEHFPLGHRNVRAILGEYINRPLNFYCRNEAPQARNNMLRLKTDMLLEGVMSQINMKIALQHGLDPAAKDFAEQAKQYQPQRVQEYMDKDWQDTGEQVAQRILTNMWKKQTLDDTFVEGFKTLAEHGVEAYHVFTVNNKTRIREISALDLFYHKSASEKWIAKGQYAGYRLYLTPSSIIDLFYDSLTVADIEKIQSFMEPGGGTAHVNANGNIYYDTHTFSDAFGNLNLNRRQQIDEMIHNFQMFGQNNPIAGIFGTLRVIIAYWKSERIVGFLHRRDEMTGNDMTVDMVDENYKPDKEAGEWVKQCVINQVYQGVKIHDDIYVGVKPFTDYILDKDELDDCLLPIDGFTMAYSIVELSRQWNKLYNMVAHSLKKDINSSLGRVLLMSLDHMPNVPGFTREKWMHWLKELKIMWVKQPARSNNMFNQFSSLDMSFFQDITAKMNLLERIKMECDAIGGFAPNRTAGGNNATNTLGESNMQMNASINQTEYMFFKHYKLLNRVLNYAVNMERKNAHQHGTLRNLMDDMDNAFLDDSSMEEFLNSKIGVYVTNSLEDLRSRQKLDEMLNLAVSNGADIVDMTDMMMAKTQSEIRNVQDKLRRDRKQMQELEARQKQAELELKQQEMQTEDQRERDIADGKNETAKEVAYIKTFALQDDNMKDMTGDNEADIFQWEDLAHRQRTDTRKQQLEERKQFMNEKFTSEELRVKRDKNKVDKYKADMTLKVAKANPTR